MLKGLAPGVWAHVVDVEGFPTASVVVLISRLALVVDTLSGPAQVAPVADFVASEAGGRRVVVVNTNHHWDHVFGNSAFAGADIVAQRACPGLIEAQLRDGDESSRRPPPGGVPLPRVVFGDRLTYEDACGDVHLLHAPGHSEDSLVMFLPESRLLLGGDVVEGPLPDFCRRGGAGVGQDAASAQAARRRPDRPRPRTGNGQAHRRRRRALHRRRLQGRGGGQVLGRQPRRSRPAG